MEFLKRLDAMDAHTPRVAAIKLSDKESFEVSELDGAVFFAAALMAMNTRQPQTVAFRSGARRLDVSDFDQVAAQLQAAWNAPPPAPPAPPAGGGT